MTCQPLDAGFQPDVFITQFITVIGYLVDDVDLW